MVLIIKIKEEKIVIIPIRRKNIQELYNTEDWVTPIKSSWGIAFNGPNSQIKR